MKNIKKLSLLLALFHLMYSSSILACELYFGVDGEQAKYSYAKLPEFIRDKIRANVKQTNDELDRYKIVISNECSSSESENSISAKLTIQKNTIYLKELNGVSLCKEVKTTDGLRCEKGQYNFVDYKGGAELLIDDSSTKKALKVISDISSVAELEKINVVSDRKEAVHNAIRHFAMLLAESARFDYVLDDLECSINTKKSINFMDYWVLVHNWGTIASRVESNNPSMEAANTHKGVGKLFVPITRNMIGYFNGSLIANPPNPKDITKDGKNVAVPLRTPSCDLQQIENAKSETTLGSAQAERDEIFSLAAMVMVEKDWQANDAGRGHNIGSILVNSSQQPVFWARNSIRAKDNSTQHGEVRLIENFLNCPKVEKYMDGYSIYTTLEPCAMCSGMIAMTKVKRVIFLQKDISFGRTLKALQSISYPRLYEEDTVVNLTEKKLIEAAFDKFRVKPGNSSVTDFLLTHEAQEIFQAAKNSLFNYSIRYPENAAVLGKTIEFLSRVTSEKFDSEMLKNCPEI